MKLRAGFVSNSSSSSSIIVLPPNFDLSKIKLLDYKDKYEECMGEDIEDKEYESQMEDAYNKLVMNDVLWAEEHPGEVWAFDEIFKNYVVQEIDSGPDEGRIILANRDKIRRILNEG